VACKQPQTSPNIELIALCVRAVRTIRPLKRAAVVTYHLTFSPFLSPQPGVHPGHVCGGGAQPRVFMHSFVA
jgi:hypothetical protein